MCFAATGWDLTPACQWESASALAFAFPLRYSISKSNYCSDKTHWQAFHLLFFKPFEWCMVGL